LANREDVGWAAGEVVFSLFALSFLSVVAILALIEKLLKKRDEED
jgi:hypothetical protein